MLSKIYTVIENRERINPLETFIGEIFTAIAPMRAKLVWNLDEDNERLKLMITCTQGDINIGDTARCNGIILEIKEKGGKCTHSILHQPMLKLRDNPTDVGIMRSLRDEDTYLYEIRDGTTVGLYFDSALGRWCYSTRSSMDISQSEWRGLRYDEMLEEVLEFDVDSLDTNFTYSIGCTHPSHHPIEKEWLCRVYSCFDRSKGTYVANHELSDYVDKPLDEKLSAKKIKENVSTSLQKFSEDGSIHLGYVLKGPKGNTLVKSDLYEKIRGMIYDNNTSSDAFRDLNFVVLKNYMSRNRDTFIEIFPGYQEMYDEIDGVVNGIVDDVVSIYKGKNVESQLANEIKNVISKSYTYEPGRGEEIIKKMICTPTFLPRLYEIFAPEEE